LLTTLPRGSVSGHVRVDGASVSGRFEDRGLAAGPLSLDAALRLSDTDLHIEHARLELLESRLIASGRLHGDALRRIDLSGRFEQLDPRVVGLLITGSPALPEGHLNGRLRLASPGGVSGPFTFGLDLDRGSRLAEQLLTGSASGEWAAGRVRNVDLRLSQGGDRLTARGSLGSVSDRMEIDISIADLTRFDSRLEGAAALSGDLSGAFDSPEVRLRLSAGSVKGSSSGSAAKAQPRVEASVQGTLARHALSAQLSVRGERLSFAGEGAWSSITGSWESRIDRLEMAGTLPAKSERAFDVVLGAGRAELRGLELAVSAGVARLDRLAWQNGVLTSSGQLVEVSLAPLADSLAQTPSAGAQGDAATREAIARLRNLRLIAQWQLEGPDWRTLSGKAGVEVRRDPLAPGEQGQAPVFVDSRMSLSLQEGRIDGTARLSVPSLAFSRRLTAPDWVAEGALSFDGRIRGTVERPELDGTLKGERLMLANRSLGWRLRDGRLDARFDGRRLRVESLRFSSGGSGGIELQGDIEPAASSGPSLSGRAQAAGIEPGGRAPFDADLALRLDSFTLPLGPGQRLLMSGATRLVARDGAVYWSGSVRADEGLIEFRSGGAPELPADLVIVDRRRPAARPASNSISQPPAADAQRGGWSPVVQADLRVAMGERLRVQGGGLDARLTGELALSGRLPRDPRVQGRLQLREGHFTAYGRKLELTRGEVRFNGELDNPSLDIVAMRRNPEVSAGVAVTGPARSPRIRLTSEPEVPDAQKLSWLVLGTGLEDAAGAGQALALREAALTLLGDDDGGLAGGLSQALGLDAIGFGRAAASPSTALERARLAPPGMPAASASATSTGSLREEVVSVSKRLNSRLTVSYERGIQGLWNLVRLQYEISNRLSLRAQSGSENAIDLLYFWWFD
jgi:translocation and assembly module TamB